jgi:hypothetical protein
MIVLSMTLKCSTSHHFMILKMQFNFTAEQSNAIAQVNIEGQEVVIRFRSNPDQEYTFVSDDSAAIVQFLSNPGDQSIGQTYHRWVKEQMLIPTAALTAA